MAKKKLKKFVKKTIESSEEKLPDAGEVAVMDVPRETRIITGLKDRKNRNIYVGDVLKSSTRHDPRRYEVCKGEDGEFTVADHITGEMIASLKFFLLAGTEMVSGKIKGEIVSLGV